jgi:hypothetical protein
VLAEAQRVPGEAWQGEGMMTLDELIEKLEEQGRTGLDLSPGDPVQAEAALRLRLVRDWALFKGGCTYMDFLMLWSRLQGTPEFKFESSAPAGEVEMAAKACGANSRALYESLQALAHKWGR